MNNTLLDSLALPGGFNVGQQASPHRQLLQSVPGLTLDDDHQGDLLVDGQAAHFNIEAVDLLRVELAIDPPTSPLAALQKSCDLPGNMRHAIAHGQPVVLAEVALRNVAAEAFRDDIARVRAGFAQALGRALDSPAAAPPLTKEAVADALANSAFAEEDIVDLDTQWEVRTRWHEDATVVRVTIDGEALRLSRVLIKNLPESDQAAALAHHALRLNGQLRQCRLVASETQLFAETRLPSAAVNANNINNTARAVAVAARHCLPTLTAIASQASLAQEYADMFINA